MNGRPLALVLMLLAAVLSFALAVHTALQGRMPIFETTHALLFAVFGLILASSRPEVRTCQECGASGGQEWGFCIGCGRIPRQRSQTPSRSAA